MTEAGEVCLVCGDPLSWHLSALGCSVPGRPELVAQDEVWPGLSIDDEIDLVVDEASTAAADMLMSPPPPTGDPWITTADGGTYPLSGGYEAPCSRCGSVGPASPCYFCTQGLDRLKADLAELEVDEVVASDGLERYSGRVAAAVSALVREMVRVELLNARLEGS